MQIKRATRADKNSYFSMCETTTGQSYMSGRCIAHYGDVRGGIGLSHSSARILILWISLLFIPEVNRSLEW